MLTSRADGAWNDDEINNMFVFDNDTRAIRGSTVSTEGLIPPGRRADHLGPPPRRPLGLFADDDNFFFAFSASLPGGKRLVRHPQNE